MSRQEHLAYPKGQAEIQQNSGLTVREYFAIELLAALAPVKVKNKDLETADGMQERARWAVAQADILLDALDGTLPPYEPT
jgi:hypothetical protein